MTYTEEGYFVLGTTENGRKFRPSDWIDRLATTFASFEGMRIHYHAQIHPANLDGQRCLFIATSLAEQDLPSFNFLMDFAHDNQLQVVAPHQEQLYSAA